MRRNDIIHIIEPHFQPYGRIISKVDDDHFKVVTCFRDVSIRHRDELVIRNDYKGHWWLDRFYRMPTLRKLKQMAWKYHENR